MISEQSDPKKQFKIQKAIREAEDDLVTGIQSALDKTSYGDLEESQFRNLVRVATTTDSAEVIKNFIHYQVGRDRKWGRGQGSLAEKIIQDIDHNIKKISQKIAENYQTDFKPIWLELIRLYLGYGARHLKYKREGNQA
jgi:hypothetical protein